MNWQSNSVKPATFSRAIIQAKATFDESVLRLNMLSPKKAAPSATP